MGNPFRGMTHTATPLTGWDSPAWRPDNTCPLCSKHGGLRVRADATGATCVECGEAWDEAAIGLLAEHIRRENHDEESSSEAG